MTHEEHMHICIIKPTAAHTVNRIALSQTYWSGISPGGG